MEASRVHGTADGASPDLVMDMPEDTQVGLSSVVDIHSLKVCLPSDMGLDGTYGQSWLLVNESHLIVVDTAFSNKEPRIVVPLADIEAIKMRHFYGNAVVEVSTKCKTFDIIRFTNTLADRFLKAVKAINGYVKAIRPDADVEEIVTADKGDKPTKCPKCGKVLPPELRICPECIDKRETFVRLLGYVWPYPKLWVATAVLSLSFTVASLIPAYLPRYLIDEGLVKGNWRILQIMVIALLIAHAMTRLLDALRGYYLQLLGQKVLFDLRKELYDHLQKLSASFYDRRQTGAIMARVIGDVNQLTSFISQGIQDVVIQFLTVIVITVILIQANWKLGLIALAPTPIILFGSMSVNRRLRKIWHLVRRRGSELNAILADTLPGIKVVKAFGREEDEVDRFVAKQKQLFDSNMMAVSLSRTAYPLIGFSTAIAACAIWAYGGYMVIKGLGLPEGAPGTISLGVFTMFNGFMWRLFQPIQQLSQLSGQLQQAATSAERIFEILDTQPEIVDDEKPVVLSSLRGDVSFENVTFGYEPDEPILKDVTLEIKHGEMIGLVGASGSGKTTLVNLLCRFYDVSKGVIKIDGVPISQLQVKTLRDQIAVVLQEPFLFHATIAENIAYGKANATREEIIWAAKMANAHDFISDFPEGYDTMLGERGTGLSGGQKQRISIARAILRDPRILILDEATSAVDTETERLIQEAIDHLVKNRTTIAIAHRLSTLKNADRIVVMDGGRVVEVGTHEELLAMDGVFSNLVRMQSEIAKRAVV